ncbi:MAG: hypothetical protein ACO1TE_22520 [Prosthecobacter sp.]
MNADLDFELPECGIAEFPPPRLDTKNYLQFIEFNQRIIRNNGTAAQVIENRSQPVEAMFEWK